MIIEQFSLRSLVAQGMTGSRATAKPIRQDLARVLDGGGEVVLDFAGVEATQSFVDELVGLLVLDNGPDLVKQLTFKNCSEAVRGIVRFVLADRAAQYAQLH